MTQEVTFGCESVGDYYYEGNWREGARSGKGKVVLRNDTTAIDGEWKNSKRNGTGKLTFSDTSICIGEWNNGLQEGRGKQTSVYSHLI